jgi:hypothetical protein
MNPYAYVGGNPETDTDPSGQMYYDPGHGGNDSQQQQEQYAFQYVEQGGLGSSGLPVLLDLYLHDRTGWALAESYDENVMHGSTMVLLAMEAYDLLHSKQMNWNATPALMKLFTELNGIALPMLSQMEALSEHDPEMSTEAEEVSLSSVEDLTSGDTIDENGDISAPATDDTSASDDTGGPCSFTPATPVETNHGEQAIGTLKVGEEVLAYNPKTRKMEDEPILHVWIHTDNDLVDLTLTTKTHAPHSAVTTTTSEVIHTNKKHPFFTEEQGFVPVGQLKLGMHVLRADGRYGVITGYKVVPGAKTMYNLEVQQDHTFTVGVGQWVVHNSDTCGGDDDPVHALLPQNRYPESASHIQDAVGDGQPGVLHIDRGAADTNRNASLAGYPTVSGYDRDEYPMAMTQEGGTGADIRYIDPSDNRGAGSFIGNQLRDYPDGTPFVIDIIDEWLF